MYYTIFNYVNYISQCQVVTYFTYKLWSILNNKCDKTTPEYVVCYPCLVLVRDFINVSELLGTVTLCAYVCVKGGNRVAVELG